MSFILNIKMLFTNFFKDGHKRTLEAKKNIATSFIIKGLSITISLILVPITINYINPTQYGIWLTLSSIVAWFSFFDMGFGNGLRNRFTEAKALGNMEKARIYISTTYAVLGLIFGTVCLLFFGVNYYIDWTIVLNAPSNMAQELSKLALIVFSFFCLQIFLKTINTVLIADQKPAKSAFFDMLGQLLALIIIFTLTKTTKSSLLYLGLTLGFVPIVVLLISSFWFYKTDYKELAPSFKYVRFSYANDIMKLGIKFFIIQIAVLVIYQTTNIIIAQVCSPQDVTVYNIAYKYFGIGTMVFSIVLSPFWSSFTDAYALKDFLWMQRTVKKLRIIGIILIFVIVVMAVFAPVFYHLWLGDLVEIRATVSVMVAIYIIINIWNSMHSVLINGIGKIKLQLFVSLIGMALNIPFAILLGKKYGIEGVVLSSVVLNLISAVYTPIQVNLLINNKAKGIWNA